MRFYNPDRDEKLNEIILYLTIEEAKELYGCLNGLIKQPIGNHAHIDSKDYKYELTVAIYDKEKLDLYKFNKKSKEIILSDE